jgi:asparagine synthase (glutamine-hydrolysing)
VIVYPENWNEIGQEIQIVHIEEILLNILSDINCNCLSYSGGIDSTIMLYLMLKIHDEVRAFTIGVSENHPDIEISKLVTERFTNVCHQIFIPSKEEIENEVRDDFKFEGDDAVSLFYKKLVQYDIDKIIACDGIDEFMCGYYAHVNSPEEKTYYTYIRRLQHEQLIPLNKNSGDVKVYLPYIDSKLIYLYSQIPIEDKTRNQDRKSMMVRLAKKLNIPKEVINRRKYGFCDALKEKK